MADTPCPACVALAAGLRLLTVELRALRIALDAVTAERDTLRRLVEEMRAEEE